MEGLRSSISNVKQFHKDRNADDEKVLKRPVERSKLDSPFVSDADAVFAS